MKKFGYTKDVMYSFPDTIDKIISNLKEVGFGVLSMIDMKAKLKEKLDKNIDEYVILGACNPGLAAEALDTEYQIGLLLPCNIIVYKKDNKVYVSGIMPTIAMDMIDNTDIGKVATKAESKIKEAINNL